MVSERAEAVKESIGFVPTILHKNLDMRKLLSRWIPRLLTVESWIDPCKALGSGLKRSKVTKNIHQLKRLWHVYYGMHMVKCPSIALKKQNSSLANRWLGWQMARIGQQTDYKWERRRTLSSRQAVCCHKSLVQLLQLSFELLLHQSYLPDLTFSNYCLFVSRTQKDALRKEI